MKYNLSEIAKNKTKRFLPPILPPIGTERAILNRYRILETEFYRVFREVILPTYNRQITQDADENSFSTFKTIMEALARTLSAQIARLIDLEGQRHTKTFMASAKAAFGVDLSAVVREHDLAQILNAYALGNAALIQDFTSANLKRIQLLTIEAMLEGKNSRELSAEVRGAIKLSDNRAKLIARDQVGKLTADLNRYRHEQAGITRYKWLTSQDERVRPRHKNLDGREYDYGEPTGAEDGLPPGKPIQCRCVAQAIVEF